MRRKKIKVTVPVEIQLLCILLKITPRELLETFLHDLGSCNFTQGSDERKMAKAWFLRGAISATAGDWDNASQLVEDLEHIREASYPYASDVKKTYIKKRKILLAEWFDEWKDRLNLNGEN